MSQKLNYIEYVVLFSVTQLIQLWALQRNIPFNKIERLWKIVEVTFKYIKLGKHYGGKITEAE